MKNAPLRLLRFLAPLRGWVALAALLGFATVGSGIGLMATAAYIIARAALHPSIAVLQVSIVGVRFFGLGRGVFRYLERYVSHQVSLRLLARWRVWLYGALEPLAPARLMPYRSGDLLARLVADVETLQDFYVRVVAPPLVAALTAAAVSLWLGHFDARLAWATLLFLALAGVGLPLLAHRMGRRVGPSQVTTRAALNAALVDGVQGAAELVAFGRQADHRRRVQMLSERLAARQEASARQEGLHTALSGLLADGAVLAALALAIPLVRGGRLEGVYLAALALGVLAAFEATAPLPETAHHLAESLAAGRRLFEVVDAAPPVPEPAAPSPAPQHFGLRLRDVRFRYAADEPPVLNGLSFSVPSGGRVAIVGPSGAGKTTLLHLLLRFWEYQEGEITLGGYDLRRYRPADVRRMMAVVSQRTHLFNGTVRQNLLLARPEADEAAMRRAARQAKIDAFLQSLPRGYDTWIGEGGLRFSGGERQRLALARAFLQDAPILLLDEPTANLDPPTAQAILRTVQSLMEGRTVLLVSHRPAGLEGMGAVVRLGEKR